MAVGAPLCPPLSNPPPTRPQTDERLLIEADSVDSNETAIQFSGHVVARQADQEIRADQATFERNSEQLEASGNVRFRDDTVDIRAERLLNQPEKNRLQLWQTEYSLRQERGRGSAQSITRSGDMTQLDGLHYTTCTADNEAWRLNGNQLDLDQAGGMGTIHHASLHFQNVPIFYFPWFRFPIDDRRLSGFLAPSLGHSDRDGFDLTTPIYWNIAPNYDATFTPTWYEKRGLKLDTEGRYLFHRSHGELFYSAIDDDLFEDERWYKRWRHLLQIGDGVSLDLLYQQVSDDNYLDRFEELGSIQDSDAYLPSWAAFSAQPGGWKLDLGWYEYQTVDSSKAITSRPYDYLPELILQRELDLPGGLKLELPLNWANLEREQSVNGERLHLQPALSWPLEDSWYFLRPKIELALSHYQLRNTAPGDERELDRVVPLYSIDSALNFERQVPDTGLIQNLQPRLFLLYVPFEDQSDIPDFDTSNLGESYANLFTSNRFSGFDRIGDSRQVSLGLTTDIIDPVSGHNHLKASIGQSFHDDTRRVSLDNTSDDRDRSNLIGELTISPEPGLSFHAKLVEDTQLHSAKQKNFTAQWKHDDSVINLGSHYTRDKLDQQSLSTAYRFNPNWMLFAKYHHSRRHDKPVNHLLGFGYESCCWGLKLLAREFNDNNFVQQDRRIYLELTFKGLGSSGKTIDGLLEDAILGYSPSF